MIKTAVETTTCVCHLLEAKHGQNHLDIRSQMNGGLGCLIIKLLGKFYNYDLLIIFKFIYIH